MPSSIINYDTPFCCLFHESPNYSLHCFFGCICYPWLRPYSSNKLDYRSHRCVFVGYSLVHIGYICFDPFSNKFFVSRDVIFYEQIFPY